MRGEKESKIGHAFWGGDGDDLFHGKGRDLQSSTRASVFPAVPETVLAHYLRHDALVREGAGVHENAGERGMTDT